MTAATSEELYATPPPPFGHAMLKHFCFDPSYINLNNGEFQILFLHLTIASSFSPGRAHGAGEAE